MVSTHLKITGEIIVDEQFFVHPGDQMSAWFDSCYLEIYESFSQCIKQDIISNIWSSEWIDLNPSHIDVNILYHSDNQEYAQKFQSSDVLKKHLEVLQNNGLTVQVFTLENFDLYQPGCDTGEILFENVRWVSLIDNRYLSTDMLGNKPKKILWGTQYPVFDEDNNLTDVFWEIN